VDVGKGRSRSIRIPNGINLSPPQRNEVGKQKEEGKSD
jgi:hypothetical protein